MVSSSTFRQITGIIWRLKNCLLSKVWMQVWLMCLSKVFRGAENTRELPSPAASKQKHTLISFSPLISLAQLSSGTLPGQLGRKWWL